MKLGSLSIAICGLLLCAGVSTAQVDFHHLTFNVGGGYTAATPNVATYLDRGGNLQAGVGLNVTRHLGLQGTFMFNGLGITRTALNTAGQPDGFARVYSFTIDPKITLWSTEDASVYVLGGGGWMRRTVEFTQPTLVGTVIFDPWFGYLGPALVPTNQVLGSITEDTGTWDVGTGLNFRVPRMPVNFYLEGRFLAGLTNGRHTTIAPITFGIRW
jgi:outer membrane protein with beta-barrel domain